MMSPRSIPLYVRIESLLRSKILSGQYEPGQKLPTAVELAAEFRVSKITINGAKVEEPGPAELGEGLDITVTDTGIGIDPQNLELIFLKFYQTGEVDLHSTDKTKFKGGGPGLGLTIAQGLIEAHGGKIWAESPGCDEQRCPGSRFHVYLPLRQSRARPDLASLKKN